MKFGVFSYGLAALAFALLAFLLRPARREASAPDMRLWIAAWGTSVWALLLAADVHWRFLSFPLLVAIESLHAGLWLWLLASLARLQNQPRWVVVTMLAAGPVAAALAFAVEWLALPLAPYLAYLGLLVALVGVFSLEQVYRNAEQAGLTPARWLCLGIAGVFVLDLFVFAESVLVQEFDRTAWEVRGLILATLVLPIGFAARRMPDWSVDIFVSRHVVYYSTSFLLVGAYLVMMSLGGLYVRESGGGWGPTAQLFFLLASGVLLATLLFSGSIRRKLKVFLAKNFFRNKYDYRIEWLRFISTLSERGPHESFHQTAIRAVAQIIESPRAILWVRDTGNGALRPIAGWPRTDDAELSDAGVLSSSTPLVLFLERTKWVVDLKQRHEQPELYDDLAIEERLLMLGPDALLVPLFNLDQLYGCLLLARRPGFGKLSFEDLDLLKTVGRHIAAHLSQEEMDRRLNESRQFEAFSRFAAFVMHDLKNSTAQLKLIVHNAERHKRNPEFVDDAIATIANTVERMSKLLTQLGQGGVSGTLREADLAQIAEQAVSRCADRAPAPLLKINARPRVRADTERLSSVVEHIVRNAQDASVPNGEVRVEVDFEYGEPRLRISDNGVGMDGEFLRERLFRPFDTTKGARGMGIGAYQAREYLRSLGGDVRVSSRLGRGTVFELVFPVTGAGAADPDHSPTTVERDEAAHVS
ncbi:MAG TPA: PEP-CTERM system histidine kinase PrsK [Steroidobacteraceae bacterium]|nr:PEP-CTERM system histidine kinase PrsK [Steroidobacteraceae bacterium]